MRGGREEGGNEEGEKGRGRELEREREREGKEEGKKRQERKGERRVNATCTQHEMMSLRLNILLPLFNFGCLLSVFGIS